MITVHIRQARINDLSSLLHLRKMAITNIDCSQYQRSQIDNWCTAKVYSKYLGFLQAKSLWVIEQDGNLLASAGIRLNTQELIAMFTNPRHSKQGLARRLVTFIEQQASRFGIKELKCEASLNAVTFYKKLGYKPYQTSARCNQAAIPCCQMKKSISRRRTQYQKQIFKGLDELNIPIDYGIKYALPVQKPPTNMVDAGFDCFKRPLNLTASTYRMWKKMKHAASNDGIGLLIVSGFRSVGYQSNIIKKKIDQGQTIEDILKVSAAPGFSEHHTGRAIDINTPGCDPLEDSFSNTGAYDWLVQHANQYKFYQSYPRNNIHNISWEPWHWCFNP